MKYLIAAVMLTLTAGAQARPAQVGKPAPAFKVTTFAGDVATADSLRGKVVVLNHWATWCAPCKAELPAMDAYYRRARARGLEIYAITSEDSVPRSKLIPLSRAMAIPLSNRFRSGSYGPIKGAVPTSYVIDRAGTVRYARPGAFNAASFAAVIDPLLAEAPPAPAVSPVGN